MLLFQKMHNKSNSTAPTQDLLECKKKQYSKSKLLRIT